MIERVFIDSLLLIPFLMYLSAMIIAEKKDKLNLLFIFDKENTQ